MTTVGPMLASPLPISPTLAPGINPMADSSRAAMGYGISPQPTAVNGHFSPQSYAPYHPEAHPNHPRNGEYHTSTRVEDGRVGVDDPFGERSYTEVKCLGDGSFGTVWLCDWHSPVRPQTYLSAMQCGAGARPEWSGKKLVALKRMKRVWDGGWAEAKNLGELASLRLIPPHDAIIPLYDAFISPKSRELYFVFECMEGNLYQLTKSRRGRPLAAGLVASCFHQISTGLHHIHQYGYFHRDMKPENLLVTTTGLTDYLTAATLNSINAKEAVEMRYEKDVSVIVKLADFGLARATNSKPPYTEYVSTRWYRAPEVLLRSREYGPPVDMWALGTILAEMVNLKPLFPGVSEIDQVFRICGTLGDPSSEYGQDERGRIIGGGPWNTGIKLAKNVGFSFPKLTPVHFRGLFNENVPQSLVDCISDLLRYNPRYRLTSAECVDHPYFHETLPHLRQTPPIPRIPFSQGQPPPGALRLTPVPLDAPPRQVPPSHSHQSVPRPAFADGDMRTLPPPNRTPDHQSSSRLFFPSHGGPEGRVYGASALVNQLRELDLPTEDLASYGMRRSEEQPPSLSSLNINDNRNRPTRPTRDEVAEYVQRQQMHVAPQAVVPPPIIPMAPEPIGKKKKWGLSNVFGSSEKHLPPVVENVSSSSSSLKRTQSGSQPPRVELDPKKAKKEAERLAREAEKQKRELAVQQQKERARAVMRKRDGVIDQGVDFEASASAILEPSRTDPRSTLASGSRVSLAQVHSRQASQSAPSIHSQESGRSQSVSIAALAQRDRMEMERDPLYASRHKARRRDDDLDHSRSSLDINSLRSRSALTIGTIDSDPGPRRNFDPISDSRRHASHSLNKRSGSKSRLMSGSNLSQDSQLAHDFRVHANVASSSSTSLGRHGQSSMSLHEQSNMNLHELPSVPQQYLHGSPDVLGSAPTSPYGHPKGTAVAMGQGIGRDFLHQGLPSISDWEGQSDINPMFKVPPPRQNEGQTTLPPFSALASVADQRRSPQHQR